MPPTRKGRYPREWLTKAAADLARVARRLEDLTDLTMGEASAKIEELMAA